MVHYIVYHNVTGDGDQGIIAYGTSVTINITNVQFVASAVYVIQLAAVNVIGQGPVSETTLREFWVISGKKVILYGAKFSRNMICTD